jgi:SNF2 family DNA or RNA helicase
MSNSALVDTVVSAIRRVCGEKHVRRGTLQGQLKSYQLEALSWMLMREFDTGIKGGFLCDEMGLGKTVEIISTLLGNPRAKTLIVVPKSIISQWEEEIEHFAPNLKVLLYDRSKTIGENHDIVLAPYSLMIEKGKDKGHRTCFHDTVWDRIVLDEGHEIRNPKSKTFRSLASIPARIRWVVTGTPIFNSLKDFVTLSMFLGFPKVVVQGQYEAVQKKFVLRRTKQDFPDVIRIPRCEFENVEIEMHPEEKALYRDVFETGQNTVKDLYKLHGAQINMYTMHILECLLRCRQAMIHPQIYLNGIARKTETEAPIWEHGSKKFETLLEMVKEHPTEKSLIFCQFTSEMNLLNEMFDDEGIKVFRLDGSVSSEDRKIQRTNFTKMSGGCVFLIQIKAGGVGLNLQSATRVYITSPSWNPATELQAIARAHRTGQQKTVYVKKFVTKGGGEEWGSVEESIVCLQDEKSRVCAELLNDERILSQLPPKPKTLGIQELRKIFANK